MQKIVKVLPFAYLLFKFYLVMGNITIQKIAIFIAVVVYILANFKAVFSYDNYRFKNSLIFISIIFVFASLAPLLHGTGDYSYLRKLVTNVNDLLCWIAFIIYVKKESKGDELEVLTDRFCTIVSFYVSFSVLCIFSSDLRLFWQKIVYFSNDELFQLQYGKYVGRFGWDGFAGFNATLMCSIGVLLCLNCFNQLLDNNNLNINKGLLLFYLLVLLTGNILYGRTGLFVSVSLVVIFIFRACILKGKTKILIGAAIIFGFSLASILFLKNQIPMISKLYNWAFEPIINYFNGNGFTATSLDKLKDMYVKPSLKVILLGDGYYTDPITGSYYMGTDVGLLRVIYLWGLIPTIAVYCFTLRAFQNTLLNNSIMWFMIVFLLIVFEAKGEAYRQLICIFTAISLLEYGNYTGRRIRFVFRKTG